MAIIIDKGRVAKVGLPDSDFVIYTAKMRVFDGRRTMNRPDLLSDVFSLNAVLGAVLVGFPPAVSGFGCLNVFSTPFVSGDTLLPGECGLDVGSWRLGAALMRTCLRSSGEVSARDGA